MSTILVRTIQMILYMCLSVLHTQVSITRTISGAYVCAEEILLLISRPQFFQMLKRVFKRGYCEKVSGQVTIIRRDSDYYVGYPVYTLWFSCSQTLLKYLVFPSFVFERN